jgi:hypothetical protein
MYSSVRPALALLLLLIGFSPSFRPAFAQVNVTTERYDQARTGANLNETQLSTSNVNVNQFGKLWSYIVSGSVQAQPLYVAGVTIPGKGTHNVLYIETMNDVVYAFDADSSSNIPLWSLNITSQVAGSTPVPITDIVGPGGFDIVGNVGIESTPYIDLTTNTMYLVARTKETGTACGSSDGNYCQRLHALDITTGAEKLGGPVIIQGSVPGTGSDNVGGTLTFDPLIENQRPSLAMANGQIFIGWALHEEMLTAHGWVMAYNATTLQQTGVLCLSPDGFQAGTWMSGRAPAVDAAGNVYYMVGNGDWNGTSNFGESILKIGSTTGMPLLDWFTPSSWPILNAGDTDVGSSGPLLIPGTDLITGAGKSAIFYVMHTNNLGHEQSGNGQIVQSLNINGGQIHGGPVYWNRSGGLGPWLYVWSANGDFIKAYHFNGATFDSNPVSEGIITAADGPPSNGTLTLSANGSASGSGIIWSSMPLSNNGGAVLPGILRALNADNLADELWNSRLNIARDDMGNFPKGSAPTVVNGRVYLGSFPSDGVGNTAVNVYGLLPTPVSDFALTASPANQAVTPGGSAAYSVNTTSLFGFSGTVDLSVTAAPSSSTATFVSSSISTPGGTTLTIATTAGTPVGSYLMTITGTSGTLTHSATVNLVVSTTPAGSGAISIDFAGGAVNMAASEVAGVVPKSNWNVADFESGTGMALVDETGTQSGATVTWSSNSYWSTKIEDTPGDFRMMKGYIDPQGQSATVSVAGLPSNSSGYDIYVYADGANGGATRTGTYQISGTGIAATSINLTDAPNTDFNGTYVQANNSSGNFVKFTITATAFVVTATPGPASDKTSRAPINAIQIVPHASAAPDFSISASPASQAVNPGNSTTYTVTIGALNGFSGVVTLSASGLPAGSSTSFSPTTITGSGTSTMTVSTGTNTSLGTSMLTVTGTSGGLAHTAAVNLTVTTVTAGAGAVSIDFVGNSVAPMASTEIAGGGSKIELE